AAASAVHSGRHAGTARPASVGSAHSGRPAVVVHEALAPVFLISGRGQTAAGAAADEHRFLAAVGAIESPTARRLIGGVSQRLLSFGSRSDGGVLESRTLARSTRTSAALHAPTPESAIARTITGRRSARRRTARAHAAPLRGIG